MSSTLSSVVSNLVRAQMGSSVPSTVTDDDLDRHVAELILKEAKKKAERYGQQGIRAYIASNLDSNAPKPNKRFLSSIIRNTDDHNKAVLRAQAEAAEEIKKARRELEKAERRKRAEEAVEAERRRRSGKSSLSSFSSSKRRRDDDDEGWDRWDGRRADRSKKRPRNWETWTGSDDDSDGKANKKDDRRRRHRSREQDRRRGDKSERHSLPITHDDEPSSSSARERRKRGERSRSRSPRWHRSKERDRYEDDEDRRRHQKRDKERSSRKDKESERDRNKERDRRHAEKARSRSRSSMHSENDSSSHRRKEEKRPVKYALDDFGGEDSSPRQSRGHSDSSPTPGPLPEDVIMQDAKAESTSSSRKEEASPPVAGPSKWRRSPSTSFPHSASPEFTSRDKKRTKSSSSSQTTRTRSMSISPAPSRSPTPGPEPALHPPSKMDKYFEESYDPRLDVAPLPVPKVPATGLINNAEFEGWDAMLELIRLRQQDKEEKKRMERLGLTSSSSSKKDKKRGTVVVSSSSAAASDRWNGDSVSVMDIEYKKRGSVREWDLGKKAF